MLYKTNQSRNRFSTPKSLLLPFILSLFLAINLFGCKPLISLYDQYAYTEAISLKVDMQNLMLESDSIKYVDAKPDISKVNIELQKAYEYAKGRSDNSLSTKQYAILLSEDGFYKSSLRTWQRQNMLLPTAASLKSDKIGQMLDQIIKLENGKNKASN